MNDRYVLHNLGMSRRNTVVPGKGHGSYRTHVLKNDGRAHTGWLTLNGKKYFFNSKGMMYANTTVLI